KGELEEAVLHHTDELQEGPELAMLRQTPGVRLNRFEPLQWMADVDRELHLGARLQELYQRVQNPVARSNILRAAVLHLQGGVYLDLDTVTVQSLRPLLSSRQFLGRERIVWPYFVRRSRSLKLKLKSQVLNGIRATLRRAPGGYRWFQSVSHLYYCGVNGAILGAESGAPLMAGYLRAMVAQPEAAQLAKHGLGTHLLQQEVERYSGQDLTIHEPEVFYPLAPEISEHWFRATNRPNLDQVLYPETRIVHWYASGRAKLVIPEITPEYVRRHADRQLYSALARPLLDG
ncbi:MAG TPA: glycosyltransferase, partial [Polyangiaceae bacterium]